MPQFCHECGSSLEPTDKFCRECGTDAREKLETAGEDSGEFVEDRAESAEDDLSATETRDTSEVVSDSQTLSRRNVVIAAASLAFVIIVGLAALWGSGTMRLPWDSEGATRDRLESPFRQVMRQRGNLLELEARYVSALTAVQRRIDRYEDAVAAVEAETAAIDLQFADDFDACYRYVDVECPEPDYPEYPDAPSYGRELERIRDLSGELNQLGISLDLRGESEPELRAFSAALVKSAEALSEEASENADLLNEAQEGTDEYRTVDTEMLDSLRADTALPALLVLNREALTAIELLGFDVKEFDVPGGTERDRRDSSQAK